MELRSLTVCLAILLLSVFSHCSEARHSLHRRDADTDGFMDDGASDTEQNDNPDDDAQPIDAKILTAPATFNISKGQNVRLECVLDNPDGVVNWVKDNVQLVITGFKVAGPDNYVLQPNTNDLVIYNATGNDSGMYTCEVLQNQTVSIQHTLVVNEAAKVINISASQGGHPIEGDDLVVRCDFTGFPPPKIWWSVVDGKNTNRKLTAADAEFTRDSVIIKNVRRESSGTYICYASNPLGTGNLGISVVVHGKPRIHLHKTVINAAVNVQAILQCSVHEQAPVEIFWSKDGVRLDSSSNAFVTTQGTHSNLTIVPQSYLDFGTYTCEARCDFGSHSRSVELVQYPVIEGIDVDGSKIIWTVHSHLPLTKVTILLKEVTSTGDWKIFDVPLPKEKKHEYEFSYVVDQSITPGKYEAIVKVENTFDTNEQNEPVFVNIAEQQQLVQIASVYRGNDAHSNRPAAALLSTILMYLLVRM